MSDPERGLGPTLPPPPKPSSLAAVRARDPHRVVERRTSTVAIQRDALFDLLDEVRQLAPSHRDPHQFHHRKDEIAARLYAMATSS